jgi:predicted O-methyltransferase YrrM
MADALHVRARRKARRTFLTPVVAVRRRRGLRQLRGATDETHRRIGDAIAAAAAGAVDPEVEEVLERVEACRAAMLASDDTFTVALRDLSGDPADGREATDTVRHAVGRSRSRRDCLLLHHLVRALRPRAAVELGTCVGISAGYQAAAMRRNGIGRLVSIEAIEHYVTLARRTLDHGGLDEAEVRHGLFERVLPEVLRELAPVDLAFVDGHHDEQATLRYAAQLKPALRAGGVIVFDDIAFSEGMERAWRALAADADVTAAFDLGPLGICVYGSGERAPRTYDVPFAVKPGRLDRTWLRAT